MPCNYFQHRPCSFLIATLIQLVALSADAINDCHIEGLSNTVQTNGQIVIWRVAEGTQFHLQCVCPLHTPVWNISYLKDWSHQRVSGPVWCSNNSKMCNPPELSFILNPTAGLYTIINLTIIIEQTTVIKCYRTSHSFDNPDQLLMIDIEPAVESSIPLPSSPCSMSKLATPVSGETISTLPLPKPSSSSNMYFQFSTSSSNRMQKMTSHLFFPTTSRPTYLPSPSETPPPISVLDTVESSLSSSALYLIVILLVLLIIIAILIAGIIFTNYKSTKSQKGKHYHMQEKQVKEKKSLEKKNRSPTPDHLSTTVNEVPSALNPAVSDSIVMDVTKEDIETTVRVLRAVSLQPSPPVAITSMGDRRSSIVIMSCNDLPGMASSSSTALLERPNNSRLAYHRNKKLSMDMILSPLASENASLPNKSTTV